MPLRTPDQRLLVPLAIRELTGHRLWARALRVYFCRFIVWKGLTMRIKTSLTLFAILDEAAKWKKLVVSTGAKLDQGREP